MGPVAPAYSPRTGKVSTNEMQNTGCGAGFEKASNKIKEQGKSGCWYNLILRFA